LILLLVLGIAGCGYRFSAGAGRLPDGGRRLCIPQAENLTTEGQASAQFTAALRRQAADRGLELVGDAAGSAVMQAKVVSIRAVPRGVAVSGGRFRAREQEVVVQVEMKLRSPPADDVEIKLSDRESYLSAQDIRGTEANRQLALQRVFQRMAEEGIERISRGF
jgi:outer membrane lipopolysaccharide assembly protein LptE/RlpB